jgi:heme/copper-type cytochrome/quinol oxidase subunit 2
VLLTTVGYLASAAVALVAISYLQRERTRAREEKRPQNRRLRTVWIAVMFAGLAALLYFTLQR